MKKVFIPSYGGGHANIMKLLYPELKNRFDVEILALTLADDVYSKANIPHKTIKNYLSSFTEEDQKNILDHGQELAKTEYNPQSSMQYEDCVVYLGMGMVDLIRQLQSFEKAKAEFKEKGRKAFCPFNVAKHILQHVQPNIVVVSVNVRFEAAVGIAANQLGIPVVYIQDCPIALPMPFKADVCVMNEYTRKLYIEANIEEAKNIHLTGQPIYDLVDQNTDNITEIKKQLSLDRFNKLVVYLETPDNEDTLIIEEFFKEEAIKNTDTMYVMKLHPNMNISNDPDIILNNLIRVQNVALLPLLANADIAITRDSTSGLEACFMDVDLIVVNLNEKPLDLDYSTLGIAIKANTIKELHDSLSMLFHCEITKQELKNNRKLFKNVPHATKNITRIIELLSN